MVLGKGVLKLTAAGPQQLTLLEVTGASVGKDKQR